MTDESVRIRIGEELEVAKRRLEAAKLFERSMFDDAVNRAYYSYLYTAKAMLNVLG